MRLAQMFLCVCLVVAMQVLMVIMSYKFHYTLEVSNGECISAVSLTLWRYGNGEPVLSSERLKCVSTEVCLIHRIPVPRFLIANNPQLTAAWPVSRSPGGFAPPPGTAGRRRSQVGALGCRLLSQIVSVTTKRIGNSNSYVVKSKNVRYE